MPAGMTTYTPRNPDARQTISQRSVAEVQESTRTVTVSPGLWPAAGKTQLLFWEVRPISSSDEPDPMGYPLTDLQCHVLREDGSWIDGLFGAGTVFTNHFRYRMYPGSGINHQFCTSMARIVAEELPAYLAQG